MSFPPPVGVTGAVVAIVVGAWSLFFQGHFAAWRERRYEARVADRLARGQDAYFEELRSLKAYRPQRFSRAEQKLGGVIMILLGSAYLAVLIGSSH